MAAEVPAAGAAAAGDPVAEVPVAGDPVAGDAVAGDAAAEVPAAGGESAALGAELFQLVARARAADLDPELELRAAARRYRDRVQAWEQSQLPQ
jgi:XTP/dITP diphosphohydrolase